MCPHHSRMCETPPTPSLQTASSPHELPVYCVYCLHGALSSIFPLLSMTYSSVAVEHPLCFLSPCQFNYFSHFKMTIPQFYRSSCLSLPVSTPTANPCRSPPLLPFDLSHLTLTHITFNTLKGQVPYLLFSVSSSFTAKMASFLQPCVISQNYTHVCAVDIKPYNTEECNFVIFNPALTYVFNSVTSWKKRGLCVCISRQDGPILISRIICTNAHCVANWCVLSFRAMTRAPLCHSMQLSWPCPNTTHCTETCCATPSWWSG